MGSIVISTLKGLFPSFDSEALIGVQPSLIVVLSTVSPARSLPSAVTAIFQPLVFGSQAATNSKAGDLPAGMVSVFVRT